MVNNENLDIEDYISLFESDRRTKEQLSQFLENQEKKNLIDFIVKDKTEEDEEEGLDNNEQREKFDF